MDADGGMAGGIENAAARAAGELKSGALVGGPAGFPAGGKAGADDGVAAAGVDAGLGSAAAGAAAGAAGAVLATLAFAASANCLASRGCSRSMSATAVSNACSSIQETGPNTHEQGRQWCARETFPVRTRRSQNLLRSYIFWSYAACLEMTFKPRLLQSQGPSVRKSKTKNTHALHQCHDPTPPAVFAAPAPVTHLLSRVQKT